MRCNSFYVSLTAAVLLMTSCNQEELVEHNTLCDGLAKATTRSFEPFDEDGKTRSVVNPTGVSDGEAHSFMWADGDQLAIYCGGTASGMTNFDLIDGINSQNATFKSNGFSLASGSEYYAFTPYNGKETNKAQVNLDYDGQVQKSNGSYDHLGAKDFQYSEVTTAASANANELTEFNLSHLGAVCRFRLTVPEAGTFTQFRLCGKGLVGKGKLDLTTGTFVGEESYSAIMSLGTGSGISVEKDGMLTIYLMLPQQDLSSCSNLYAKLITDDGEAYVTTNLTGKNIEGGKAYGWTANVTKRERKLLTDAVFTVNKDGKKVRMTMGNLWWDGSQYHLEEKQTDYPTEWDSKHVGHFFWVNSTDYQGGKAKNMPYNFKYDWTNRTASDKFFCGEDTPLTVDGIEGLFVLTLDEWKYLTSRMRRTVTVEGHVNCGIAVPDSHTESLKSSYTFDELEDLDIICLPASGEFGCSADWHRAAPRYLGQIGYYWTSTPREYYKEDASFILLDPNWRFIATGTGPRDRAKSIRLVKLAE